MLKDFDWFRFRLGGLISAVLTFVGTDGRVAIMFVEFKLLRI